MIGSLAKTIFAMLIPSSTRTTVFAIVVGLILSVTIVTIIGIVAIVGVVGVVLIPVVWE